MTDDDKTLKIGGLRLLTLGEINLSSTLYGFSIRYNQVWIHRGSYLPFNMQNYHYAMTPNGEMYFMEGTYEDDFSMPQFHLGRVEGQHLFLHEMMHVWQHQHGMNVRLRGAFSWAADYSYSLDKANLFDYGLEQQACIVSDYWLLKTYGFSGYSLLHRLRDYNPDEPAIVLLNRYKELLGTFPL